MSIIAKKISLPISLHYNLSIIKADASIPLIIALHGYGENKEKMMALLNENLDSPCIIVSLQAPYPHIIPPVLPGKPIKYGFGWITSFNPHEAIRLHHMALDQIIEDIRNNADIKISKILLLGFSQSVALNFRYVYTHPHKIDGVIAICGGIPGDWDIEGKYTSSKTDVLYIGCQKDLIYHPDIISKNVEKLKSKCRSIELQIYDDKHVIPEEGFNKINYFVTKV